MEISAFPMGLVVLNPSNVGTINNEHPVFKRTVRGYSLDYRITRSGDISVSRIYSISQWHGSQPKDFTYKGICFGVQSDVVWNIQIIYPGKELKDPVIQLINGDEKKGFVLFARLLHADILPGLAVDDILQIMPFCQVVTIAIDDKSIEKDHKMAPNLLLSANYVNKEKSEESKMQIFIAGEIISVDYNNEFDPSGNLSLIRVKTPNGPLPMELNLAILGENLKPLLKKGNIIRATGWLFADAATALYASGMILDVEHNLRVLGFGAQEYDFSRTRQIFSDNSQYFTNDELRAVGPEAIIDTLNGIARLTKERKYKPDFVYGQIFLKNESETFQQGEKCLVFLDAGGQLHFLMCARTDEAGRISKLYTVYHIDDIDVIKTTTNFQKWCGGLLDAPEEDENNAANKNQVDFYRNPELEKHLHGDSDAFFGEPFYGFGDMVDILMPGEGSENMEKVTQWIGDAQLAGQYQLGSFIGAYLDYPESNAELGLQFALGKEPAQNSFQVEYFYPLMQGYSQYLEIVASFDWPDKVCGYIAIVWGNKSSINCFAPTYRLWNEKIIIGQHFHLKLAGLALHIEPAPHPNFSVEKGQFYEMNLAQFLYENPDKTAADFEAPVVHTEESVILIPQDVTCLYEMQAPVKKVEKVKFGQNNFTRLLMPIARDWEEDEELLAWIYVSDKALGKFRPKPGDPVLCVIWLCAHRSDIKFFGE